MPAWRTEKGPWQVRLPGARRPAGLLQRLLVAAAVCGGLAGRNEPLAGRQPSSRPASSPPTTRAEAERTTRPAAAPLSDLDRALLEGLPDAPPRPGPKSDPSDTPSAFSPSHPSTPPLDPIARRMRQVHQRLARLDTSAETQAEQAQIIQHLRQLLEAAPPGRAAGAAAPAGPSTAASSARDAAAGAPARAGEPAGAAGQTPSIQGGQGSESAAPVADLRQLAPRIWGHLPEKLREEMQSALGEAFVPKYERLIEQYYRRLAEEPPSLPQRP